MQKTQEYITANKDRFLSELIELLRIPSISADIKYKPDIERCAEFIADKLRAAGCDKVEICPAGYIKDGVEQQGNPVIYAEKIIDKNLPTVLVYSHYDVQPPDPVELWESPPFEPVIKKTDIHPDGAIFSRGADDDKGQGYMHVKAFEAMVKMDSLPCNVKFCIEGEEEVGSPSFQPFVEANKEKLACDVVLCSDTSIIANDVPSISTGVRGLTYLQVEVTGPSHDLHSGTYGGAVGNPIIVLAGMIAKLIDEKGQITIPGFYEDVEIVGPEERKEMDKAPFNLEAYKKFLHIDEVQGEQGYNTSERTTIRPSLDCNGIWGGYTGEGSKTVIPSKAFAKISMRLVPHQRSERIFELFRDYFSKLAPPSVKVKVTNMHGGEPGVTPIDTPEYRAAHLAMEKSFGKAPIPKRIGGYIPIVSLFKDVLNVDSILMGFGLNSDVIHSPNEHFGLFNFFKGIETIPYYYHFYANLKKNGKGL
jgi:acetylornithine deacetylase/succinyl-diaminopimelate desuccinylase-like protein